MMIPAQAISATTKCKGRDALVLLNTDVRLVRLRASHLAEVAVGLKNMLMDGEVSGKNEKKATSGRETAYTRQENRLEVLAVCERSLGAIPRMQALELVLLMLRIEPI